MNQEKHHRSKSFSDEYLTLLRKFEIDFKEEYVFEFYD
jgi:putative transposase